MSAKVLFLDDMKSRHNTFFDAVAEAGHQTSPVPTFSAEECIALLGDGDTAWDQVFLDHDLSEGDIMCEVGQATKVPTGMTVVDHIIEKKVPIREVFVHSCNRPAALVMTNKLEDAGYRVKCIPFPQLITLMLPR